MGPDELCVDQFRNDMVGGAKMGQQIGISVCARIIGQRTPDQIEADAFAAVIPGFFFSSARACFSADAFALFLPAATVFTVFFSAMSCRPLSR